MVTAWQQERRRKQAQGLKSEAVAGLEALLSGVGGITDEQERQKRAAMAAEDRDRKIKREADEAQLAINERSYRRSREAAADAADAEERKAREEDRRAATEARVLRAKGEESQRASVLRQKQTEDALENLKRRAAGGASEEDLRRVAMADDALGELDDDAVRAVMLEAQGEERERAAKEAKNAAQIETEGAKAANLEAKTTKTLRPKPAPSAAAVGVKQAKDSMGLRKEFSGRPEIKTAVESGAAFRKMEQAAKNPSAAGDLSLVFSFMKVLDPGSTVREGEFANAQNATGVPEAIRNQLNRVVSGERLNPAQRADFLEQARRFRDAYASDAAKVREQYRGIAQRSGLNPIDVVGEDEAPAPAAAASPAVVPDDTPAMPPMVRVTLNGEVFEIDRADLPAALADGAKVVR
jgi:hypothetical protein